MGLYFFGESSAFSARNYLGQGAISFQGSAQYSFSGLLSEEITGSGGIQFSSRAVTSFNSSGGILENQDWSVWTPPPAEFLQHRLVKQLNPHLSRDIGPEIFGDLTQELDVKVWVLQYFPESEEIHINGEFQFSAPEVAKIDFSCDVWGYPVIAWTTLSGQLFLREYLQDFEEYFITELETSDCREAFICSAERRLPWSHRNNKVFLVYIKGEQILYRTFLERSYGVPRTALELEDIPVSNIVLEGLGVTPEHRLQINARLSYGQ